MHSSAILVLISSTLPSLVNKDCELLDILFLSFVIFTGVNHVLVKMTHTSDFTKHFCVLGRERCRFNLGRNSQFLQKSFGSCL